LSATSANAAEARIAADEARLQKAGLKTDGEALLDFFRKHTVRADQQLVRTLVRQLSHRSFSVRRKATNELIGFGARAVSQLREATNDPELEVRRRAEECLRQIQNNSQPELVASAGRLLALRHPAGAAEALLDFLPSVFEDATARELHGVLAKLTVRDSKTDPAVIKALSDE